MNTRQIETAASLATMATLVHAIGLHAGAAEWESDAELARADAAIAALPTGEQVRAAYDAAVRRMDERTIQAWRDDADRLHYQPICSCSDEQPTLNASGDIVCRRCRGLI